MIPSSATDHAPKTWSSDHWKERALRDVMQHIVDQHHTYCRRELPRLSALFKGALAAYASQWPELRRMEALFGAMAKDLQLHLIKEEQTLFPYIARVEDAAQRNAPISWPPFGTVENPIRMMILEHEQTGNEVGEIRRLSNGFTPPAGAPEAVICLCAGLRAFDLDMSEHVHFEDHLLFPRAIALEEQACNHD